MIADSVNYGTASLLKKKVSSNEEFQRKNLNI